MTDCLTALYELARKTHPYTPATSTEQLAADRADQAKNSLYALGPEQRHAAFDLWDSMDILSCFQARHFFSLGLDLGLSIARELRPFQEVP